MENSSEKQNNKIEREEDHKQNSDIPPFELKDYEKQDLKTLKEYEKTTGQSFFSEGDYIYFKDLELDEESFQPVMSQWKRGTVT